MTVPITHYGNDQMGAPTTHTGTRDNCPAPECGPDLHAVGREHMPDQPVICTECHGQAATHTEPITPAESGDPITYRTYAVCPTRACGQWGRLMRRFDDAPHQAARVHAVQQARDTLAILDRQSAANGTTEGTTVTTVTPNPPSPYADADPTVRHMFPSLFGPPLPGHLAFAGCDRLAVVPPEMTETGPTARALPDGLCPACVAAMRGQEPPEDIRPVANCRECDAVTDHDGLCAMCRMDAHDQWWAARNETKRTTP